MAFFINFQGIYGRFCIGNNDWRWNGKINGRMQFLRSLAWNLPRPEHVLEIPLHFRSLIQKCAIYIKKRPKTPSSEAFIIKFKAEFFMLFPFSRSPLIWAILLEYSNLDMVCIQYSCIINQRTNPFMVYLSLWLKNLQAKFTIKQRCLNLDAIRVALNSFSFSDCLFCFLAPISFKRSNFNRYLFFVPEP